MNLPTGEVQMNTSDDLSRQLMKQLSSESKRWLLTFPNVTDASIGLRMKNGSFTSELVVVVYVSKKSPAHELSPQAMIPGVINGLPTDVQVEFDPYHFHIFDDESDLDLTRVRPLRSGIAISATSGPDHTGTLGCFGIRNSDKKRVLVSNYHVLFRNRALPGMNEGENKVYQPRVDEANEIGVSPSDAGAIGGSVDCAYAVLAEEGSCCCSKHTIPHNNTTLEKRIVGVASAQPGQKVFKHGIRSGLTVGKIVNVDKAVNNSVNYSSYFLPAGDKFTFSHLIMIVFWDQDLDKFDETREFSKPGDSGSAVLNENGEMVGLNFMSYSDPATGRKFSFACHVDQVEAKLGITIPGTRNLGPVTIGPIAALDDAVDAGNIMIGGTNGTEDFDFQAWWETVRTQLQDNPAGKKYLDLIDLHIYEIMRLINRNREVTINWHNCQGPAFVAAIARSAKHPEYELPATIEGVSLSDLFVNMGNVLTKHGSNELKTVIQSDLWWLIRLAGRIRFASDILEAVKMNDLAQ